jgi:hypothetical protein
MERVGLGPALIATTTMAEAVLADTASAIVVCLFVGRNPLLPSAC